jgi:predicted phage-related endonuclease
MPRRRIERHVIKNEAQWLALRQTDVTASVVAALFGLHPFETPAGLHAKVSGIVLPARGNSGVLARGRELQELVGRYVQRNHPQWKLRDANVYLRDPTLRLGATPDFFARDLVTRRKGIVEAKTVASAMFRAHWSHGAPTWISLQTLTCMMLARADFGLIAALEIKPWGPPELHEFFVPRHESAEQRIIVGVRQFWTDVLAGNGPRADYARDGALIAAMTQHAIKGKTIDLSGDNRMPELLARRAKLKAQLDQAEAALKVIENEVKDKIGDAEIAVVQGWRVTLKEIHKREHTVRATTYRSLHATKEESAADVEPPGGGEVAA